MSHDHGCTCMYLDEQLGGIKPLLLRCCGVLSSQYRLHNVRYCIAGALPRVRMPCRRPWTPPLWELPHDRHLHVEVSNVYIGASEEGMCFLSLPGGLERNAHAPVMLTHSQCGSLHPASHSAPQRTLTCIRRLTKCFLPSTQARVEGAAELCPSSPRPADRNRLF